ncbi:right-handed parallel beta-helix repeat-containing protein [Pedobacter psychrodurus]|nr:right-handed parallel beta-helix repeat-containing protein [Pedobacter psychrodurus]
MNKLYTNLIICLFVILSMGCERDTLTLDPGPGGLTKSTAAKTYYVSDLSGSDTNLGLSLTSPFKTIAKASELTNPGDVVLIMNGNYISTNGPLINILRSGEEGKYITYKAYSGHAPKLLASGNVWNAIVVDASFINIEDIELQGNNANLTLADAQNSYLQSRAATPVFNANWNTNGISVASTKNVHHITIKNCKVHDFPGGGIGVGGADYVTIEGNTVYNNSWYTMYATSGISILAPKPIDAVTTYKMIVRGNTCYNNKTMVNWRTASGNDRLSDGNGIIIDANNGTQGTPIYTGRTLVENNISYNNGGGGIHAFQAARVDIINNTAYNNGLIVGYPEIDSQSGLDVKIYNNIMYARTTLDQVNGKVGSCNLNDASAVYDFNIYFGASFRNGTNDKTANPQFVNLSTNPAVANFSLQLTSPAINAGTQTLFAPKDILGVARPKGSTVDCGAYEVN